MESMKTMKERSAEKSSNGSPMLKKAKKASVIPRSREPSPDKILKPVAMEIKRESRVKKEPEDNSCGRCSKGFFF